MELEALCSGKRRLGGCWELDRVPLANVVARHEGSQNRIAWSSPRRLLPAVPFPGGDDVGCIHGADDACARCDPSDRPVHGIAPLSVGDPACTSHTPADEMSESRRIEAVPLPTGA